MVYEFRYYFGDAAEPVSERAFLHDDRIAIAQAAGCLLQMPSRRAVEVWRGKRLVYSRRRDCAHEMDE